MLLRVMLFPGIVFVDPECVGMVPVIPGIEFDQLLGILFFILPVLVIGYYLEWKRLAKA